jgi:hypothetical protein
MSAVQIAMPGKLPYTALRAAILTHPTLTEGMLLFMSASTLAHRADNNAMNH